MVRSSLVSAMTLSGYVTDGYEWLYLSPHLSVSLNA